MLKKSVEERRTQRKAEGRDRDREREREREREDRSRYRERERDNRRSGYVLCINNLTSKLT